MYKIIQQKLEDLDQAGISVRLRERRIGLEREALRVNQAGSISQTAHPAGLGSPLTHPAITTDYSEALLELITPPMDSIERAIGYFDDLHRFVYTQMPEELLWAASMPCVITGDRGIPIASYGQSNPGMMKTIYRRGLAHRYGRVMQVIAGVHYNYSLNDTFWEAYRSRCMSQKSLQDFKSEQYLALIRNLQRMGWLVIYLFGASPAVCKSFLQGKDTDLEPYDETSYYGPDATSLRMGDIGYQNNKENETGIKACYYNLEAYVSSLESAIRTPCPDYEKIGVRVDGEYRQLNTNILQIENEYYSTVRPKQVPEGDERPSRALSRRGVEYIELRSLDLNIQSPLGIDREQLLFLDLFMLCCLLLDSPGISVQEQREIDANEMRVAHQGRKHGLELLRQNREVLLKDWAAEICQTLEPIAMRLDELSGKKEYARALESQKAKVADTIQTPSAQILEEMRQHEQGFFVYAREISEEYKALLTNDALPADKLAQFVAQAEASILKQKQIEQNDRLSFEEYLQLYYA